MKIEDALAPVLRDMRNTGAPTPKVSFKSEDSTNFWLATLTASDGSSHGISLDLSLPREYVITAAAVGTQEWVFDELQIVGGTNWPPCPLHPRNHPLDAAVRDGNPAWVCPAEHTIITEIGALK